MSRALETRVRTKGHPDAGAGKISGPGRLTIVDIANVQAIRQINGVSFKH